MPKDFKYDISLLINCVKDRPCLWDKSLDSYKDRIERRNAWEEIFSIVDDSYHEMLPEDRRKAGEVILNKWTNVRDTFVKSLKTKMGKPKKKYILYDELKFLRKNQEEKEDYQEDYDAQYNAQEISTMGYFKQEESDKESTSFSSTSKRKSKWSQPSSEEDYEPPTKSFVKDYSTMSNDIAIEETYDTNDSRLMNEDEAFFASLLPTVVKYSEDERLEFRIEVLALMRRIKQERRLSSAD